ncbi:hypothetical protein MAR_035555 [Mya arenaria]|uniref:Uncharacterized protein n=1 Tax=Mya arenaria TaxID=6604 RepID=A0ABY7END2_MYAAR|nr:hypothetical protein MAR_035555 [Mya arenaria]
MYVEWLHVTLAALLLVTMVPVARGNSFIDAYNQATNDLSNDDTSVDKLYDNRADFFMQAVHENGIASSTIADATNFVNLLAIFLNVGSIDFEECTKSDSNSPWRPITGICNNLQHPRWGTPKIAQLRLAPAFWENVGLVVFDPLPVHLTPVDSKGVQLETDRPLIFNLQGTSTFTLAVTSPAMTEQVCKSKKVKKNKEREGTVDGMIISVIPDVDGKVVDKYKSPEEMFDKTDLRTFWMRIDNDQLLVGAGSECDERTVILKGEACNFTFCGFGLRTPGAEGHLDNKHVIEFENTETAFWVSAISNRVYAGAGNEVGKEAMIALFSIPEGTDFFRPNNVIVRSLDEQWATPRKTSLTGRPLPTARDVSLAVHTNIGASTTWSKKLTMAVMQMGQFVDHDLIATPGETGMSTGKLL